MTAAEEEALVKFHIPFARSVARKLHHGGGAAELERRRADALLGLLHAVRTFDPERGRPFLAWARLKIRSAVLDGEREHDPLTRIGRHKQIAGAGPGIVGGTTEQWAALPAREEAAGAHLEHTDLLHRLLRGLSARELEVVRLYWLEGWTSARIGGRMNLSESLIRLMTVELLQRLRDKAQSLYPDEFARRNS